MKLITLAFLFVVLSAGLPSSRAEVEALYVFGDSLVDVGNYNYIEPGNPAMFSPYGIDMPDHKPTGRFSNAYNSADYIAMNLGFDESPPPYLSFRNNTPPLPDEGFGANFASAASGILDETVIFLPHISLTQQIDNFELLKGNLSAVLEPQRLDDLLSDKSIFLISAGSNDLTPIIFEACGNNCVVNPSDINNLYRRMICKFEEHLQRLYNLGARKFAVVDIPTIGWTPLIKDRNCSRCAAELNDLAGGFNNLTKDLLRNLSKPLVGMKYSLCSSYKLLSDAIAKPKAVGFTDVTSECLRFGEEHTKSTEKASYCPDRHKFLFWDYLHPTDATSMIAALAFYAGQDYASPINIKQLALGEPAELEASEFLAKVFEK